MKVTDEMTRVAIRKWFKLEINPDDYINHMKSVLEAVFMYIECEEKISNLAAFCAANPERKRKALNEPQESEWIKWEGGLRPVDVDTKVEFKNKIGGNSTGTSLAKYLNWDYCNEGVDIVAYRIIEEPKICTGCNVNLNKDMCNCPAFEQPKKEEIPTLKEFISTNYPEYAEDELDKFTVTNDYLKKYMKAKE